jgi:ABC-type taurine transport system substrate-binding protein
MATNLDGEPGVSGHSEYYKDGAGWSQDSESLKNLTRITLGKTGEVTTTHTSGGSETTVFRGG